MDQRSPRDGGGALSDEDQLALAIQMSLQDEATRHAALSSAAASSSPSAPASSSAAESAAAGGAAATAEDAAAAGADVGVTHVPAVAPPALAAQPAAVITPPRAAAAATDGPTPKRPKNRCATCRKKTGLTGFTCRCGGLYCAMHRYGDAHQCTFDYKTMGKAELTANNPMIVPSKVDKL